MGRIKQVKNYVSSSVNQLVSNKTLVEWKHSEQVEVQAFAGSTTVEELGTPVMVRVAAPPREAQRLQRTPVDVIAVLNTSKNMEVKRVELKEAMKAVIMKLDDKDRFSLVTLEEHAESVEETMELVHMQADTGRATAVERIERVTSRSWSSECSVNVSQNALQRVAIQMEKTAISEERHRCVMLLSCGEDRVDMTEWVTKCANSKFQLHTFDLGAQQHDAEGFKCQVDKRVGTYHYLGNNTSITKAFEKFSICLTTVVATSVRVRVGLKAEAAAAGCFSISSPEAGGHCGSGEHQIHIADMHAGEQKSFIIYVQSSSASQKVTTTTVENILSVDGGYQQGCSSSGEEKYLPCLLHGKETTTTQKSNEVAAEVVRSMVVKKVKEIMVKEEIEVVQKTTTEVQEQKKTTEAHHVVLEKEWTKIKASAVYEEARSTTLVKHIEKDVTEMKKSEGRVHMMSWLSCHWWQRATCTTMSHYSYSFEASSSKTMMAVEANGWERWWKPCLLVVGVLFLLLVAILLGRHLYSRRRRPLPAVRPTALDVVGKHPEWPAMVSDLDVLIGRAKEDSVTSFFKEKGASPRRGEARAEARGVHHYAYRYVHQCHQIKY